MKRIIHIFSFIILILLSCCKQNVVNYNPAEIKGLSKSEIIANKLKKAYPEYIKRIEGNLLIWNDSTTMMFDDGITNKSFDSLLNYADIDDQFYYEYPNDSDYLGKLAPNIDPGRIRNETFFKKMYGNTKEEVKRNLVEIIWMPISDGTKLFVTKINGVHEKMQSISNELDSLPDVLKKYVVGPAGTFHWREIAGTNRLSTHSFGIAIDINVKYSNYWKWQVDSGKELEYKNNIPLEIVKIFEKYGFIWGGKWYHYDTMHFEYRPELINLKCPNTKITALSITN